MQDREIIEKLEDLIKEAIKSVIERLALEERSLYLEEHPETKGNGFYLRGLEEKYRSRKLRGFEELAEEGLLSCGHS